MITMCLLAMIATSLSVKAQEVTITLMPGWTWISVPITEVQDFATTLGSFTPMTGDIIKSQWGNATYANGQWRGNISQFYPGYGYMYKSTRMMPVTVTFNAQPPAPEVIVTTAEPTDITTNSATCSGNVTSSDGNYVFVILRGICWSTNPNPTFNDNYVEVGNGLGSFTASMTDLAIGTTYYVRAFAVTTNGTFFGEQKTLTTLSDVPIGAINGLFSINADGDQVYFSQGNLQYIGSASTPYWKFADNQWDVFGTTTGQYSSDENVDRDLFGWGTSGYNHGANCYQPWSTSVENEDYYAYGDWHYNLFDQTGQADWGYNPVSNGGNMSNQWRTLTQIEWDYIFNIRNTTSGIRYVKAKVNGKKGVILLPDDWNASTYDLNNINCSDSSFNNNVLSASQWIVLEQAGSVFLPVGNLRNGISSEGAGGWYWSASHGGRYSYVVVFGNESLNTNGVTFRSYGSCVRLVQGYQP